MTASGGHQLTVVCCRGLHDSPGALQGWLGVALESGAAVVLEEPNRSVVTVKLGTRSQAREAVDALLATWLRLAAAAELREMSCVGVLCGPDTRGLTAARWSEVGIDGELLWTRSAFEELVADGSDDWSSTDHFTVEQDGAEIDLVATRVDHQRSTGRGTVSGVIGRQRERQVIERAIRAVATAPSPVRVHLLMGAAGMGKSTLIDEAGITAAAVGCREIRTHCVDYAQVQREAPVGRFITALAGLAPVGNTVSRVRSMVGAVCERLGQGDAGVLLLDALDIPLADEERTQLSRYAASQLRSSRAALLADWVRADAVETPLLLVFEDLHWASDDVFELLEHLSRPECAQRFTVLATSRPGLILPDACTALRQALSELELGPLASQDARKLALLLSEERRQPWQVQSGDFIDDKTVEQCLLRAEGNPLHLTQLLALGGAERRSTRGPGTLDALFAHRLARLARRERSLIEVAACIGFYFDAQRPLALADAAPSALAALESARLVLRAGEGHRFGHALIRDAVLLEMPAGRRQEIQLALAATEADLMLRAERWADAMDARAFQAFMDVAEQRRSAYQWLPAQAALERAGDVASGPLELGRALMGLGALHEEQGDGAASLGCFVRGLEGFASAGLGAGSTLVVEARLGILAAQRLLGRLDEAEETIELLRRQLDGEGARTRDPLARARLDSLRGAIAFSRGRLDHCRRSHAAALRTLESAVPPLTRNRIYARALSGMGDALYAQGAFHDARDVMGRCIELARAERLGRIEVSTLHMLGIVTAYVGDAPEGHALARQCWEQACQVGDARSMLFAELNIALTQLWDGRAWAGLGPCSGGVERAEGLGSSVLMGMTRAFTGHIRLAAGDVPTATRDVEIALEHVRSAGERLYGGVALGLALALAARDPEQVRTPRVDEWLSRGSGLLDASVVSHNYLYFALGLVPVAVARRDVDLLWRLLNQLRDFFRLELEQESAGTVSSMVAWVTLQIDLLGGNSRVDTELLRARIGAQPLLAAYLSEQEAAYLSEQEGER